MEEGEEEEDEHQSLRVRCAWGSRYGHTSPLLFTCPILLHIIGHGPLLLLFLVKVFIRRNNVHGF